MTKQEIERILSIERTFFCNFISSVIITSSKTDILRYCTELFEDYMK